MLAFINALDIFDFPHLTNFFILANNSIYQIQIVYDEQIK